MAMQTNDRPDADADGEPAPVTIKKYANRRLYNTATSSYVTLDSLGQMVKDGTNFVVYDAKSGDDITHAVLTQIIVEEETKGQHLLPIGFLRQLIAFYGQNMQTLVPNYLEHSLKMLASNQDRLNSVMQSAMQNTMSGMFPLRAFEEMSRQNMAVYENAVRMFTPFGTSGQAGDATDNALHEKTVETLVARIAELEQELAEAKAAAEGSKSAGK